MDVQGCVIALTECYICHSSRYEFPAQLTGHADGVGRTARPLPIMIAVADGPIEAARPDPQKNNSR